MLPPDLEKKEKIPYVSLVGSILVLFATNPLLRTRGLIGFFSFTAMTVLMTPLALVLSDKPPAWSTAQIGLLGLSGIAGAVGASYAGRRADRGQARIMTLVGLACMLSAWALLGSLPLSILLFIPGLLAFDFSLQAVHVSNQSVIYAASASARSRLAAGYMVFYSVGCALGAAISTRAYEWAAWPGVVLLGGAFSLVALAVGFFSAGTRAQAPRARSG